MYLPQAEDKGFASTTRRRVTRPANRSREKQKRIARLVLALCSSIMPVRAAPLPPTERALGASPCCPGAEHPAAASQGQRAKRSWVFNKKYPVSINLR